MREFERWLLHEDQKEVFESLFATVLTVLFLGLSALLLWPLGRASMSFHLAKGYWLFGIVLYVAAVVAFLIQRLFRVDIDSNFDAYVLSGLAVSGFLQVGWSAFAALTVHSLSGGVPVWIVVFLYLVGFFSCYVAYVNVSVLYMGSIYRQTNLMLAVGSFIIFSVWPKGGRAIYGWFFDLF
ncbi:MAG TPA: hypothetical protein VF527_18180 [Pyrinomonadaceae bacterium]|jgi:hypothetical protein